MSVRKPIEPGCNFSVTCDLPGHVTSKRMSDGSIRWSHFKPTPGQRKTRREQWLATRIDPSTIRDVREPDRPTLQDSDTLTKIRAAHTEYRNTGDLHELARAMNTLLGT